MVVCLVYGKLGFILLTPESVPFTSMFSALLLNKASVISVIRIFSST